MRFAIGFRSAACLAALAAILVCGPRAARADLSFDSGSVTITHDGEDASLATSGGPLPAIGTVPTGDDSDTFSLDAVPSLDFSNTYTATTGHTSEAAAGLYHLTSPTFASVLLATGSSVGQDDPPTALMDPSAQYAQFAAFWNNVETSVSGIPFASFFLTGDVGGGGFVGFDAVIDYYEIPQQFAVDGVGVAQVNRNPLGTLNLSYFNDAAGAFSASIFSVGAPFVLSPGSALEISGTLRFVADNQTQPSQINAVGGASTVVPVPAAAWAGLALLAVVAATHRWRRRCPA